jgi:hypothetical protein
LSILFENKNHLFLSGAERGARIAHDNLYVDPAYPSHFLLPVAKNTAK